MATPSKEFKLKPFDSALWIENNKITHFLLSFGEEGGGHPDRSAVFSVLRSRLPFGINRAWGG